MRIGLVVDSACDLPPEYLQRHGIVVMPITIRSNGFEVVDVRDTGATLRFYERNMADARDGETAPLSAHQIKQLFLDRLVIDYDYVFCETIASARSPIFANATQASLAILSEYRSVRAAAGLPGPFALRVIDSQNLFAAQGLVAAITAGFVAEGLSPTLIRERLDALIPQVYGYMLPGNLYQLRARAQKKGDRSVGWLRYAVGSALDLRPLIRGHRNETGPIATMRHFDVGVQRCFDYLLARLRAGLLAPYIVISYGGPLSQLRKLPGFAELERAAHAAGVELLCSLMSITGAINVGEGALSFALAAAPHDFE